MKIGILGGGQLGRMLALSGYRLGIECRLLDSDAEACAGQVAELQVGDLGDPATLDAFGNGLQAVTVEWENVPVSSAERIATQLPFRPPPAALAVSQDRIREKTLFRDLGIGTAPFATVDDASALAGSVARIGLPAVLKTRRLGYDGRGQWLLRDDSSVSAAAEEMEAPCILEGFVSFERELSLLAVRSAEGETAFYPLVENQHREGILRLSLAPAPGLNAELQNAAEAIGLKLLERLDYVGVLTVELFQTQQGLLANEIAPRVHNSGHWTIEGAETSQFENHLRAVAGLPLGSTAARGHSAMINLIGEAPPLKALAAIPGLQVHLYGKSPRPGRKVGHITLWDSEPASCRARAEATAQQLRIAL